MLQFMRSQRAGDDLATEQLLHWQGCALTTGPSGKSKEDAVLTVSSRDEIKPINPNNVIHHCSIIETTNMEPGISKSSVSRGIWILLLVKRFCWPRGRSFLYIEGWGHCGTPDMWSSVSLLGISPCKLLGSSSQRHSSVVDCSQLRDFLPNSTFSNFRLVACNWL